MQKCTVSNEFCDRCTDLVNISLIGISPLPNSWLNEMQASQTSRGHPDSSFVYGLCCLLSLIKRNGCHREAAKWTSAARRCASRLQTFTTKHSLSSGRRAKQHEPPSPCAASLRPHASTRLHDDAVNYTMWSAVDRLIKDSRSMRSGHTSLGRVLRQWRHGCRCPDSHSPIHLVKLTSSPQPPLPSFRR